MGEMRRHMRAAVVMAVLTLAACAAPELETASADGTLDCADGQVPQTTGGTSSGSTEQEAVDAALAEWADSGAELVEYPAVESWSAVVDSRDVAVVVPELNGDGSWFISHVTVCGDPDVGEADIEGTLDCPNSETWIQQGSVDPDTPGDPTAEQAIRAALEHYQAQTDAEIVLVDQNTGSIVVEGREQVIASATEVPAGGWTVLTVTGCGASPTR